jgi:cell division protein FtsI (penicillin-binding protein 3)
MSVVAEGGAFDEGLDVSLMPDFHGMSMRQVLKIMAQRGLNVKMIGSGRAMEQNPLPGQKITPSDRVWIKFSPAA